MIRTAAAGAAARQMSFGRVSAVGRSDQLPHSKEEHRQEASTVQARAAEEQAALLKQSQDVESTVAGGDDADDPDDLGILPAAVLRTEVAEELEGDFPAQAVASEAKSKDPN